MPPEMRHQETLTSRERVIRTLNRQPVDRMPIDLGMHVSTGISAFAYWRLREHLGLDTDRIWIPDTVQMLAMVDEDIRQRFHLDCILLEPRWNALHAWSPRPPFRFEVPTAFAPVRGADGDWQVSGNGGTMRMPAGGFFFDGAWLCNWGGLTEEQAIARYAGEAERIYKETPYATAFLGYAYGGGLESFFTDLDQAMRMLVEPESVKAENEARLERNLQRAGRIIDAMGDWVQMVCIGNDMGMQAGPVCRPSVMEECVFPYYQRLCAFIHHHSDIKIFMHNCGSIRPYLPLLAEAGIDVINPVQISADDMDAATLKHEVGDRLIFWGGGCDTQYTLGARSVETVREHVRNQIRIFGQDGGYVFNQVHNVMADVPPENIVAMLDTAYAESFRR